MVNERDEKRASLYNVNPGSINPRLLIWDTISIANDYCLEEPDNFGCDVPAGVAIGPTYVNIANSPNLRKHF